MGGVPGALFHHLERAVGLGRERVLHALDAQDEAVQRGLADDRDALGSALEGVAREEFAEGEVVRSDEVTRDVTLDIEECEGDARRVHGGLPVRAGGRLHEDGRRLRANKVVAVAM